MSHNNASTCPRAAAASACDPEFAAVLGPPVHAGDLGTLGPYRVLGVLGRGGQGTVFRGYDPALRRELALKVLDPRWGRERATRARFLREARALAAIRHEHVVPIYHVGCSQGVSYLALPRLCGRALADVLRGAPLPLAEVLRIGFEAASGLAAVHAAGLVHRDVKPANLWLEEPDGRVKVLDLGLVKRTAGTDGTALTDPRAVLGTPNYMSPEQARGRSVDVRSDVCSLGAVLYRATTGRPPADGPDPLAVLVSVVADTPAPPAAVNPHVPVAVSDLIVRMLAKRRRDRIPSAAAVVAELSRLQLQCTAGTRG